jgi:hypothetical protein
MSDAMLLPPQRRRLKILMTEGSSISARQALYALGPQHAIDILDPSPFCQCRFSRLVRRWHRCPRFTADPCGYLSCLGRVLKARQYDVLFPPHDEVYLLARVRDALARRVAVAIPEFSAVARLHSKTAFLALMQDLQLGHPETTVITGRNEPDRWDDFPCFVKLDTGTAGQAVRLVHDRRELQAAVQTFAELGQWTDGEPLLLQRPAIGHQAAARAVFRHGQLVGIHMSALRLRGVGGAPVARESCVHPVVVEHFRRLGERLAWHGALFAEYFYDETTQTPTYIEADPRIGDSANATLSGVNLCQQWLDVALGQDATPQAAPAPGVPSHAGFLILMSQALEGASRRELAKEMWRQWRSRGIYRRSHDEMTRPGDDWLSVVPYAWVTGQLLIRPATAAGLVRRTVDRYALSPHAAARIRDIPLEQLTAALES